MEGTDETDEGVMALLSTALRQPPSEREVWLRLACGDDEKLYRDAFRAIRKEEEKGFLSAPPHDRVQGNPAIMLEILGWGARRNSS
jgi:hypothetical protein